MGSPSFTELYLAWRQAKTALYFEQKGSGLIEMAKYESELSSRLESLQLRMEGDKWFDELDIGEVWVVPKRLSRDSPPDDVIRLGSKLSDDSTILDIQLRLSPSPDFAIAELLFLRRFGPALDNCVSKKSVGYRLDLRGGELNSERRWTFEYWPKRYQEFRKAPLRKALKILRNSETVMIVSADLASFYDTIDPSFLLSTNFIESLATLTPDEELSYRRATQSLLCAYERFRAKASARLGVPIATGIPIGSLTSRVVANVSLTTLDEYIAGQPNVLLYRRYVDDLVIVANAPDSVTADSAIRSLLPVQAGNGSESLHLDVGVLQRPGCEFELQRRKSRVHYLSGKSGEDFVGAVAADFDRLVSRSHAFLDTATLAGNGASQFVRASVGESSPLNVLRDADRTRLERFALSTSLRTLERASVLLDHDESQRMVRSTLEGVAGVLTVEDDWVGGLEVTLRLLRVAIATRDWESSREVNAKFDEQFGTTDSLRASFGTLRYRGNVIGSSINGAWTWLRNYLHERRLESVSAAIPGDITTNEFVKWCPQGLVYRTTKIGAVAVRNRAVSLAMADLRTYDRENDRTCNRLKSIEPWIESSLPELADRFSTIRKFLDQCEELNDESWSMSPARLFLVTRPPSYFDVARRMMYRAENGLKLNLFQELVEIVNALRGTQYWDPIGTVRDSQTVQIPWAFPEGKTERRHAPTLILGNLVVAHDWWEKAARGQPVHSLDRLTGLTEIVALAELHAKEHGGALLVLPELSVPRSWFRLLAQQIVRRGGFGAVIGLEYRHSGATGIVYNQAHAVIPGPYGAAATWPWTKRWPADAEGKFLARISPPLRFHHWTSDPPRIVVETSWGRFSTLICSELIEAGRVADLLGRVELILCPAWNTDTASYDHLIQSVGFQLHAIVAVANNGHYSDCRAWAPHSERWKRDLCRLIERDVNDIVRVKLPLQSLIDFHNSQGLVSRANCGEEGGEPKKPEWRPLPPKWE